MDFQKQEKFVQSYLRYKNIIVMRLDVSILKYNGGGEKIWVVLEVVATAAKAMPCQAIVAQVLTLR